MPAPSLPTGIDWSTRPAIARMNAGGTCAVTLPPAALAVETSAAPSSRPRSEGFSGEASTFTRISSPVGAATGTSASDSSSCPPEVMSERSCRPLEGMLAMVTSPDVIVVGVGTWRLPDSREMLTSVANREERRMGFEVLAEGLQFPEGALAMPDGSVILVEIARGTLSRAWNGKVEAVCDLGGGPNNVALGPDGAVYVTNNGGGGGPAAGRAGREAGRHRPRRPRQRQGRTPLQPSATTCSRLNDWSSTARAASGSPTSARPAGGPEASRRPLLRPARRLEVEEISFGSTGYNGVGLAGRDGGLRRRDLTGRLIAFDLAAPAGW